MAFVKNLERDTTSIRGIHPTTVPCRFMVGLADGTKIIQLNTYGSEDRVVTGQYSQTLQFNEETALQLYRALRSAFDFKDE